MRTKMHNQGNAANVVSRCRTCKCLNMSFETQEFSPEPRNRDNAAKAASI